MATKIYTLTPGMRRALEQTWNAIGMDCLNANCGKMSRIETIEAVLDCDRIEEYGDAPEDELKEFRALTHNQKVKLAKLVFLYPSCM
jgi:hypothetical protein